MIGYPIWYGDKNIEHILAQVFRAGFNYIELSLDYPWPFKDRERLELIHKVAQDYSLRIGIHGPWRDIALASPIEGIRRASLDVYRNVIEVAAELEANYLNIHLATVQAIDIDKSIENDVMEAAIKSAEELCDIAYEHALYLTIENDPGKCCSLLEHLAIIAERVEKAKFCFDVGHVVIAYTRKTRRNKSHEQVNYLELASQWATTFKDRLILLHLHDYKIKNNHVEDHLPPRTSNVNIKSLLKTLRGTGIYYILLEVFYEEGGKHATPDKLSNTVREVRTWSTALLYP